jgi:transcription initiation factor TFIID subunit TAF12
MALVGMGAMQAIQNVQSQKARISQDNQQTQLANEEAQQRAEGIRAKAQAQMASGRVRVAASGVTPEGSPADVLASAAADDELDAQTALWRGTLRRSLMPAGELYTALPAATRAIGTATHIYR